MDSKVQIACSIHSGNDNFFIYEGVEVLLDVLRLEFMEVRLGVFFVCNFLLGKRLLLDPSTQFILLKVESDLGVC
jgi:hypothetical protein